MQHKVIDTVHMQGVKSKKTAYDANLEIRKRTKENIYWDTDDDLDGLLDPDPGSYPELATEFPGVIME